MSRRSAAGFTLVEATAVLVVMAVLVAVTMPSLASALRRGGALSTARQLQDCLSFAQAAAVARRRPVDVDFDTERRLCRVSIRKPSLPWLPESEGPRVLELTRMEWPQDVQLTVSAMPGPQGPPERARPDEVVRFEPSGSTRDTLVELDDPGGGQWSLQIIGATGEVRLEDER